MNYFKSITVLLFAGFAWSPSAFALSCDASCHCSYSVQLPAGSATVNVDNMPHYSCTQMADMTFDKDKDCRNACVSALQSQEAAICAKIPNSELPASAYATPKTQVGDGSPWNTIGQWMISPTAALYTAITQPPQGTAATQTVSCDLTPTPCPASAPTGATLPSCTAPGTTQSSGGNGGNVNGATVSANNANNAAAGLASNEATNAGSDQAAATAGGLGSLASANPGAGADTSGAPVASQAGQPANSNGSGAGGVTGGGSSTDSGNGLVSTAAAAALADPNATDPLIGGTYGGGGAGGKGAHGGSGSDFGSFGSLFGGAGANGGAGGPGANGSSEIGAGGAGRSLASADGAMGSQDPADYFDRLKSADNIFKVVERRIQTKSLAWDRAKLKEMK